MHGDLDLVDMIRFVFEKIALPAMWRIGWGTEWNRGSGCPDTWPCSWLGTVMRAWTGVMTVGSGRRWQGGETWEAVWI